MSVTARVLVSSLKSKARGWIHSGVHRYQLSPKVEQMVVTKQNPDFVGVPPVTPIPYNNNHCTTIAEWMHVNLVG